MYICWLDVRSSYSHASLALPVLERAVAQAGLTVQWHRVSATPADRIGPVVAAVVKSRPQILAGTVYLFNRQWLLAVMCRVKALLPECAIILGGPEFLGDNQAFLRREPSVLAVLRGEGEASLPALLKTWEQPRAWEAVPGLCWIDLAGGYHDGGPASMAEADMANLAPATGSPLFVWDVPFIQVETTRGCPQRCSFCTSCRTGQPRRFPLAKVRAELDAACAHGIRDIRVLDRTFNLHSDAAAEWLRRVLAEYPGLGFHLEIHPGLLGNQLRELLRTVSPGRLHLEVGLQTTDAKVLKACERGGDPSRDWEGLEFLASCSNLSLHIDLLAGLPELTFEQLQRDVAAVMRLGVDEVQLEILKVLPGTPLAASAAALGLVHAADPPYEVLRTTAMEPDDLVAAARLSVLIDGFHNHPALREVVRAAVRLQGDFVPRFLAHLCATRGIEPGYSLEKRFLLLSGYCANAPELMSLLASAWFRAGLSPASCPVGEVTLWKGTIPERAELCEGAAPVVGDAGRIWHCVIPGAGAWWYILHRHRQSRGLLAVYRMALPD